MKRKPFGLTVICLLLCAGLHAQTALQQAATAVNLLKKADYNALATMSAPGGKCRLSAAVFEQAARSLKLKAAIAVDTFKVMAGAPDTLVKAEVLNNPMHLQLVMAFNSQHKLTGFYLEPYGVLKYKEGEYTDPANYTEQEVLVQTGPFIMPGTLTLPKNKKHFPILVYVHGSGNNNRDESVFALRPFRDLAHGLAAQGIASLRYDKRNKIYGDAGTLPGQMLTMADETTDDAASAIKLAAAVPGADQVFEIGHSQGGMMTPRIAAENKQLAGAICMSGPSISLLQSYENQYHTVAMDDMTRNKSLADIERIKNSDTMANQATVLLGKPAFFWTHLRQYDQLKVASTLTMPLLFLQGERDYQVTPDQIAAWKNATRLNKDVTVKMYPKLNHFYSEGTGPSTSQEYFTPGNVPAYVINDVAAWINSHKQSNKIIKK